MAFEEKRPDLFIAFATLRCVLALYRGDTAAWLAAKERLANMTCLTEEERVQRDFALGHVLIGLYDIGGFPPWFAQGDFESLPEDCYPFARFVYLKYLGIKNQSNAAALPARPLVAQCHADGALVAELYCRLLVAIGYLELGELSTAAQEIDRAIALALPDRLCAPLAEYRDNLGTLLDERLALVDREMLRAVKALNQQIREGWTALNRDLRGLVNTVNLTQQERQVAKLAAQGLSNAEIAARMHIKVNTVKGHVSEAISKTGAHSRSELAKFIGMEAPSE